ncbi:uncharacterized protein [Primulina eburnea]|uniref:uncharacterized protein n=1 Tax=Primulina eburnea TaxID=1245227 RepID=UPI003C6C7CC9
MVPIHTHVPLWQEQRRFINSQAPSPMVDDPSYKTWKANDSMVKTWLVGSMNQDIGDQFLFCNSAAAICEAGQLTYSCTENTSELFATESLLYELRQGDSTVTQFFSDLTRLWQKIDLYDNHKWTCSDDSILYNKVVETKRVFKFLSGLNKELDDVRGRVLGTKPLPTLSEAFSSVRHEEGRRKVIMGGPAIQISEGSALVVETESQAYAANAPRMSRPYCDHYRKLGHTKDTCWKIHGKPPDWKPRDQNSRGDQGGKGNSATTATDASSFPFSKDQLDLLRDLISKAVQSGRHLHKTRALEPWPNEVLIHRLCMLKQMTHLGSSTPVLQIT